MDKNIVIKGSAKADRTRYLTDEDIDKMVRFLRDNGYHWGVVKGSSVGKVALYSREEDTQLLFQKDGVHLTILSQNKKYRVLWKDGLDFDPEEGQITIDLSNAQEMQL